MRIENLKLIKSSRKTGHPNIDCELWLRNAVIGNDYGLANQIIYTSHGYGKILVARVVYKDGCTFGDNHVCMVESEKVVSIYHISSTPGHSWSMVFKKNK